MNEKIGSYHVVDLTPARRVWLNTLDLSWSPHCIYGLLEVDVTVARRFIAERKARTGETLSFTGFLVYCLARAVDEDKAVQAYLKGRKQLVMFDDVNVGLMVEGKIGESALYGACHPGCQPQDIPRDPLGDSLGTVCTGAAEQRHAHLVPYCPVTSVATVCADQDSARYGHAP
jgi:hypothetical protein